MIFEMDVCYYGSIDIVQGNEKEILVCEEDKLFFFIVRVIQIIFDEYGCVKCSYDSVID